MLDGIERSDPYAQERQLHNRAILVRCLAAFLAVATTATTPSAQLLSLRILNINLDKLDPLLHQRATQLTGSSRVIVRGTDSTPLATLASLIRLVGGTLGRELSIINGYAAVVPNVALPTLSVSSLVLHISLDRLVVGAMERTGATVGATAVRQSLGYDGSGIGVAVIDSGITGWHDDLTLEPAARSGQRVHRFIDFVAGRQAPYDNYGHGTHVAGTIAGNGLDSGGARAGIAPGAHLVILKTLNGAGRGRISDVIAALGYVVLARNSFNIRVVNLSIGTGVYESYNRDPLTLAARRVVSAGIVVVAAAGNYGRDREGRTVYGGITAPGNAPWVLTVGGASHTGTIDRSDDTIALFSSRGPTAIDRAAKPDLVAPGVGIESLSDPLSAFYTTRAPYLLNGTVPTTYLPYLSLSGTSMAAPTVAGTVALMLQANPSLTPNQVKAILRQTAERHPGYDRLTQGAGFLDARAAVDTAKALEHGAVWNGVQFVCTDPTCGGGEVGPGVLGADGVAGTDDDDTVVWGMDDADTVVWGMDADDTVVWGMDDGDTVVWGMNSGDTVVWGMGCTDVACEPVIWGQR
jgi:serine protease AprX